VHVQADQPQAVARDRLQRGGDVLRPDAVLAVLAAGVGLAAVAVAEAGVDAQPDAMAVGALAEVAAVKTMPACSPRAS